MYNSNTFARSEVQILNGYNAGLSIEAVQKNMVFYEWQSLEVMRTRWEFHQKH